MVSGGRVLGAGAALVCALLVAGCGSSATTGEPRAAEVHLFGLNDLHGHLQPPEGSNGKVGTETAGGAAYLAAHLAKLKAEHPDSAVLAAGDMVGASPLVSALFHDEPTIRFLNSVGVAASSVGNHEFDHGVAELRRLQQGGCASDGCTPGESFTGAAFPYLAANVTDGNGQLPPGLKAWTMLTVGGHKIAAIGTVTPDTGNIVLPEGIRGYTFGAEADAVNKYVPEAKSAGAEAVVVMVHDGGAQRTQGGPVDYNGCADITPNVTALAEQVDDAVKVILTAHSHQAYNCTIDGKVVTQAASFGRIITDVTLRFHDGTVDASAVNRLVTRDIPADTAATQLVNFYAAQAKPLAERVVGNAAAALPGEATAAGDSPMGDVIADSMLAVNSFGPVVAAFMNPGGVRAGVGAGAITYQQLYTAQPFGNTIVALTLTGEQILKLLEQQWDNVSKTAVLAPAGITYAYSATAPKGQKVIAGSVRIGGTALDPAAEYQIATNNFLSTGGDGFSVFTQGKNVTPGPLDLDALQSYLSARGTVDAPVGRVERR
ncbi:bifunctional metallophosphatase/5'-nucleotidase [Nocardia yamanashiensis]|uniref:bifunctional metallophosphatase/5'-nucleotidase n=1 Tax=Nocardia yamanashiensis TaxID=209247 RepID=UPI001E5042DB|nr:bifunctional metallophosphatase/5'-nucleotidase [Nocardia yamanashiensis]UGT44874.1 bifunctional metallophosphatase/5'-nucleotidase [Nocardia yamanashiensis]